MEHTIEIIVFLDQEEEPKQVKINHGNPLEALIREVAPDRFAELEVFLPGEDRHRERHHRICDSGIQNGHHVHVRPIVIHYTVDNEHQETKRHEMTPIEIMNHAEVEPKTHYLVRLLEDDKQKSYKDHPEKHIHMHSHMRFITPCLGPTPVS